jgi:phosphatidylglycerol:prolipoprotein diacylglycerol transferase
MHPVLFEIPTPWGGQAIYSYGVMLGLSLLLGWQIVMLLGKRVGLGSNALGDVYLTATVSGIVGARLLYVWTNHAEFQSFSQWFDLRSGGLVAWGGFLGGFLGALVHLRAKRMSLLAFADCAAPAIAAGLCLTRIGCYLYGCDFGTRLPDNAPAWLARLGTFPRWTDAAGELRGSPAFLHQVSVYGLSSDASAAWPVHPTQLYEAVLGLLLTAVCLRVFQRRAFVGQALLVLTILYGVARFFMEYVRDDPDRGEAFGFSTSQLIALTIVPAAAVAYSLLRKRARHTESLSARA